MSYVPSMKLGLLFAGLTMLSAAALAGCSAPVAADPSELGTSEAAIGEAATLTFGADFQTAINGTLQKGKTVRVAYDASRLTACRGDQYGHPGWTITGYWKIGGGAVHSFEAGGFSPSGGTEQPVLALDASGDLQVWFQNSSVWGCMAAAAACRAAGEWQQRVGLHGGSGRVLGCRVAAAACGAARQQQQHLPSMWAA